MGSGFQIWNLRTDVILVVHLLSRQIAECYWPMLCTSTTIVASESRGGVCPWKNGFFAGSGQRPSTKTWRRDCAGEGYNALALIWNHYLKVVLT